MIAKIQKWGNSQGLRIARQLLEETHISIGDDVEVAARDGIITIVPVKQIRGRVNLAELVSRIPGKYKPGEVDWGKPEGAEVW